MAQPRSYLYGDTRLPSIGFYGNDALRRVPYIPMPKGRGFTARLINFYPYPSQKVFRAIQANKCTSRNTCLYRAMYKNDIITVQPGTAGFTPFHSQFGGGKEVMHMEYFDFAGLYTFLLTALAMLLAYLGGRRRRRKRKKKSRSPRSKVIGSKS